MKATTDAKSLAAALDDVYKRCNNEPYAMPDGRPLAPENLAQTGSAEAYKDCWDTINDSIRSVTQAVLDEQALAPLRAAVTSAQPEFEKLKGARSNAVRVLLYYCSSSLPSFLVCESLSLSLSIYCSLLEFSDTTWRLTIIPLPPSINQSINTYYHPGARFRRKQKKTGPI
jgi:hypothetical protein